MMFGDLLRFYRAECAQTDVKSHKADFNTHFANIIEQIIDGVAVAKLAGLPKSLIARARQIMARLEVDNQINGSIGQSILEKKKAPDRQLGFMDFKPMELVQELAPKSPVWKDCFNAFWIGGLICTLGQLIMNGYSALGLDKTDAGTATSMTLVALSALLTGLSLYDNIAKYAGAGTLVPITGFANSIAAPALEFKTEGFVLGTCVKMFTIAGPVLTWGISASVAYGLVLWLWEVMG